jgi:hypothetical protein
VGITDRESSNCRQEVERRIYIAAGLLYEAATAADPLCYHVAAVRAECAGQMGSQAQMGPEAGSELHGIGPMASPSQAVNDLPAPVPKPANTAAGTGLDDGIAAVRQRSAAGRLFRPGKRSGGRFLTYSWNFGLMAGRAAL